MRFRQLLRSLARMPLFTGITVLTLALGIGANTAIFSVIEGVLLKPLPYPRSDELVTLDHAAPGVNLPSAGAAPFQYFTYREEGRVFQDVGLWATGTVSITGRAEPEEVPTLFATDGVLPMLGVQPMLGRLFSKADDTPATPETVVLTAGYWRLKFGSDNAVIGKSLMVDSKPREIIGVLPDTFRFLDRRVSLVVPYRFDRSKVFLGNFSYTAIARLKPGTTVAQANAEVARLIPISFDEVPAVLGRQRQDVRRGAHHAEGHDPQGRSRRRRADGAVGADGDDRRGPAHRLCERRQPAAGPRRVAAAGAGDSRGARRRHRAHRA